MNDDWKKTSVVVSVDFHQGTTITSWLDENGCQHIEYDMNVQVIDTIGSQDRHYTNGYERWHFRESEETRKAHAHMTACVTIVERYDEWETRIIVEPCGHQPKEHHGECKHEEWYENGLEQCECDGYTKPAFLMVIA